MLNISTSNVVNIYAGSSEIDSIYLGEQELYSSTPFVFAGLTSSGATTTNESEIASYMIKGLKDDKFKTSLTTIEIPDTYKRKPVTKIGYGALANITSATSIQFGKNINFLDQQCFAGCTGLTNIDIPDSITTMYADVFLSCTSVVSATIGAGVTTLYGTFRQCSALKSIVIPNNVTRVTEYAFGYCSSLTSVIIGENVTKLDQNAFVNCTNLKSIGFNAKNCSDISNSYTPFDGCGSNVANGIELWIGEKVTRLPAYMFAGYTPSSAPNITFVGYSDYWTTELKTLGSKCFNNVLQLKGLFIPASVNTIEAYFLNNTGVTAVNFDNKVGWKAGSTSISESQLTDETAAGTLLRNTYLNQKWTRT